MFLALQWCGQSLSPYTLEVALLLLEHHCLKQKEAMDCSGSILHLILESPDMPSQGLLEASQYGGSTGTI